MLSSLKVKNFRIYWIGMFVSLVGSWIQTTAQSWLIFSLTNSAFLLGLVGFLSFFPVFLFSLIGGVVADRVNKRRVLLFTQNSFMLLAFILAILTSTGLIKAWHIMVIAAANGIVMAFDAPSRQAVVAELVGKKNLLNAIALNSAAFNSARIIGASLAAILIAIVGMSGCFYINGISFFAVIIALFYVKLEDVRKNKANKFTLDIYEGLKLLKSKKELLILVSIVGITSLFGISYVILMPVFAEEIFKAGVRGLGALMSSAGIGALSAGLILARLGDFQHKGRALLFFCLIFSFALIGFSLSKNFIFSLIILAFVGWASVSAISLVNTLLQTIVPDEFRGRIMSIFMLTFAGFLPFGNLIAGWIAQLWSAPVAVFLGGTFCFIFFISVNIFFPEIKEL